MTKLILLTILINISLCTITQLDTSTVNIFRNKSQIIDSAPTLISGKQVTLRADNGNYLAICN